MAVVVVPTRLTADGSSGVVTATGNIYRFEVDTSISSGTIGGGTVTPYVKSSQGNWIPLGTATLTEQGSINVEVAVGDELKAVLSGSTDPVLVINIKKVS